VPLTPKVYEVLQLLVQNSGHMLGKEELLKAVWPDSFVEEGNLTRNISTLRAALGENSDDHRYIETVPKRGYRFVADVRQFQNGGSEFQESGSTITSEEAEELNTEEGIETTHEPTIPGEAPRSMGSLGYILNKIESHRRSALITLTSVVAVTVAFFFFLYWRDAGGSDNHPIKSVAVLPFVNSGGNPDEEYLSEGISESVINNLSPLPELKVISRTSSFRYKGKDPQVVAKELGVEAIVTGRILQRGDGLLINVELVNVRDQTQVWGKQYNRKLTDVIAVTSEVAEDITEGLRLRLSGENRKQLAKHYTGNFEAYQAYLLGQQYTLTRTDAGLKTAIDYFQRAIKIDPNFAPAYVGLAKAYHVPLEGLSVPSDEVIQKMQPLLLKALALDNDLAEAHALIGRLMWDEDDWLTAEKEFKRAIELDHNSTMAHSYYSAALDMIGRNDEAMTEAKRALEIDPSSPGIVRMVGLRYLQARRYDDAIEQFRKALNMDPSFAPAHSQLGLAYVLKGMYEDAIAEFQKARAIDDSPQTKGRFAYLAYAYALSGNRIEAQKMLDELKKTAKQRYIAPINFAIIYTGLDEKDQAFEWLEKVYKDRSGPPYLQMELEFDRLRSDPRFADLARRKGLAP
jgi:TolB-like protein/DNA-binding winged helix-turn-helix (wHTH) protein/Tfp pilus assembly protein PilF